MTEVPVFIPYGRDRLAGIVGLPEGRPRALTLLLQGLGAPRSHKYGFWTRTARELAARGIASLRIDYQMLGDSTGSSLADLHNPPVDEAVVAAQHVSELLGIRTFAAVGNCMGGRTALGVAARLPGCAAVSCILPGNLDAISPKPGEHARGAISVGARRFAAKIPRLKKTLRGLRKTRGNPHRPGFLPILPVALQASRVQLLYLGTDQSYERLQRALESLHAGSDGEGAGNPQTALIPAGQITSFRLPMDLQPKVIEAVVDWLDQTLTDPSADAEQGPPLASVAEEATGT